MDSNIVVSISCITFNHEPYIRACLDGFIMQQCSFDFEILIHDDASSDNTQEIIKAYQKKYPDIIKPILQTENQLSKGITGISQKYNFARAKGKYIACCEGDDYWTDPHKLQKQVDFMETHEDFALVCTQNNTTEETRPTLAENKEIFPYDILHHNPISTLTVLFRQKLLFPANTPKQFKMLGDYPLWLAIARQGRIMKLKDNTAYYRILMNTASFRGDKNKQLQYEEEILQITRYYLNDFNLTIAQKKEILAERLSYVLHYARNKGKISSVKYYFNHFSLNKRIVKQVVSGLFH